MFPTTFGIADGLRLHCHLTPPLRGAASVSVILVHTLGDHHQSLPYRELTRQLSARGMAVYAYDLRGHGQSPGTRVYIDRFSDYRDDLQAFIEEVERTAPQTPIHLVGLGLGGLIVLDYAQNRPAGLRGVVAIAPWLEVAGMPNWRRWLLARLAPIAPKLGVNAGMDFSAVARDQVAVRRYTSDPSFQRKITPRLTQEIGKAIAETQRMAAHLRLSVLLLQGSADTIAPATGSALLHANIGSWDKELRLYDGALHNLLIETERANVIDDIHHWIARRV
jgi:alpha-beta hydrolase superfamily lysophospholipase